MAEFSRNMSENHVDGVLSNENHAGKNFDTGAENMGLSCPIENASEGLIREGLKRGSTLFLLTGFPQLGKTRWLQSCMDALAPEGVQFEGVIAPGVWKTLTDGSFEKLGIQNVLLPVEESIPFAKRRDLALQDGSFEEKSQSAQAGLHWEIDDAAIERVNGYFAHLLQTLSGADEARQLEKQRVLVVDELGGLELMRGQGLTYAVELLKCADTPKHYAAAVLIVRPSLVEVARELFSPVWEHICVLSLQ